MKVKTYLSTDWIEVHDHDSIYVAKVYLTYDNQAYIIVRSEKGCRFFQIDTMLLKLGELGFFENVSENAKELPFEVATKMGLVSDSDLQIID